MKTFLLALSFTPLVAWAQATPLIGTWKYTEYMYEGNTLPAPNPALDLRFTFDDQGLSLLKWSRSDETGFCERKATYSVNENSLTQKVTWVNPDNDQSCAADPDMQMDKETVTKFHITDNKLSFEFELKGKPFLYILTAVPKSMN